MQRCAARLAAPGLVARAPRSLRAPAGGRASRRLSLVAQAAAAAEGVKKPPNPITLTPAALQHLQKLRQESGGEGLLLRMGVKSGGCSGMSYVMDFEKEENVKKDDLVMSFEAEGGEFKLVCDPKSLLCEWPPSAARNARCALHALATLLWPAVLALNNHSFPAS
ncbi:hypothetical protein COHA_002109 [Chlorella ohadii]|uniref:Core domain-containing protein n=1 Tax=Chlorella ohadii TaxID=2649997 RepID=A0AAD5H572_9CHLO|nr:hypothetical protein COHA_002109 [Chlorella ohadii]